ncbi:MAG: DUF6514 family protein [Defluviitaleaceae bacterium]|nr:DUF6514 family protein [Defluviitaleaceae bacterium]
MREIILTATAEDFVLKYFRTEKMEGTARFYGIAAEKYINDALADNSSTGPLSEDAEYVERLMACLAKNTVTPMVLCEVLDDIIV